MGAIQKKDAQVHPSVQVSDAEDVLGELATKGEVSTTTSTKKKCFSAAIPGSLH